MSSILSNLTEEEKEELYLVPVWVSILIAGADNKIDRVEIKKAIKIAREKQIKESTPLVEYYRKVAKKFEVNLKGYIALMPNNEDQRIKFLLKKLERVNYFFSKLEKNIAYQLYLSFRDFANKVAQASGGIFGLLSVSYAESKYIDLNMIADPSESRN
jgi:hypothetical protein